MPFIPAKATADMIGAATASGIVGVQFPMLASAISEACAQHFVTPGTVTGTVTGSPTGPGVVSSVSPILGVIPDGLQASILGQFTSRGLIGSSTALFIKPIAIGVSVNFATMMVVGIAPGVGVGAGVGKIVGFIPAVFEQLLIASFTLRGIAGALTPLIASALADGIDIYINAVATVPVISAGPVIPAGVIPVPITGSLV